MKQTKEIPSKKTNFVIDFFCDIQSLALLTLITMVQIFFKIFFLKILKKLDLKLKKWCFLGHHKHFCGP